MSLINVDKIDPQSGTALEVGTSGDTVTVPSGVGLTLTDSTLLLPTTITSTTEVKTNKISPATGTAFALGDSGDTFTVPSGATLTNSGTATGFGKVIQYLYGEALVQVDTDHSSPPVVLITLAGMTLSSSSNKVFVIGHCGQARMASAGTSADAGITIQKEGSNTAVKAQNFTYPTQAADMRGHGSCSGLLDGWSGSEVITLVGSGFGSGVSYQYQDVPSTLFVMEISV